MRVGKPASVGHVLQLRTHAVNHDNFIDMRRRLPLYDQVVTALIEDLYARGLDTTGNSHRMIFGRRCTSTSASTSTRRCSITRAARNTCSRSENRFAS